MTIEKQIMKLQTYKMFEDEDTVYVERDDVLKLLEQEPCETQMIDKSNFSQEQYKADLQSAYDCGKASVKPCEDAISRQSAIFLANDLKEDLPDDEHIANMVLAHNEGILEYQTKLSLLPPVTPQPKIGHWIDNMDLGYHVSICSNCDWRGHGDTCLIYKPKYCPNCGAKMQEV